MAAVANGVPIAILSIAGIEIAWIDGPPSGRPRSEILAEIAVGTAGIAAEQVYRFGRTPDCRPFVSTRFTAGQLEDFAEVHDLAEQIDPDGIEDVMFLSWRNAAETIGDDALWATIEKLAEEIQDGAEFRADDVARILKAVEVGLIGKAIAR